MMLLSLFCLRMRRWVLVPLLARCLKCQKEMRWRTKVLQRNSSILHGRGMW